LYIRNADGAKTSNEALKSEHTYKSTSICLKYSIMENKSTKF
jgi:hypothetical protein